MKKLLNIVAGFVTVSFITSTLVLFRAMYTVRWRERNRAKMKDIMDD